MTVKELRELLAEAPDDMEVLVGVENHLKPGMLAFAPACECETGISALGEKEDGSPDGTEVFLVLPHGFTIAEEDIEEGNDIVPELN